MRRNGHIRERSPGAFELRYSLGTDPATGRRRIATATVRGSKKDAEKELRRLLRSVDTGEHIDPNRITVREWLTTWLDAIREEVAPKTSERYGRLPETFFPPRSAICRSPSSLPFTCRMRTTSGRLEVGATARRGVCRRARGAISIAS
jgi:hypothetical protein